MTDVRALKDKASQLSMKGKHDAALDAWKAVVASAPEDVASQQKVAETLIKLNRKGDAVKVYEDVAQGYAQKGLFFKASAVCRLVLGLDPQHQRTLELISSLYAKNKAPVPSSKPAPKEKEVEIEIDVELAPAAPAAGSPLPQIPLFSTLNQDELKEVLATAMEVRACAPNDVILAEGAPGDSMFALVEGIAGIYRNWGTPSQQRVSEVKPGEIFGEVALVSGAPRVATVVAEGEAVALEFPREAMKKVVSRFPHAGQMLDTFCNERLLANALRASPILKSLPESDQRALAAAFRPRVWKGGELIITEGQVPVAVHVLMRGTCVVTHRSGQRYGDLAEGDFMGEVSILTQGPATATVRAQGPVLTLELTADEFKACVMKDPQAMEAVKQIAKERLLKTVSFDAR
ncbi:MAG: cyclic nucleotide-binding domain-containing protein [Myxococcaceae bacterium]